MECTKYNRVDCDLLENIIGSRVTIKKLENLSGKVNHVGMGGADKLAYTNGRGERIFVIERSQYYAPDGYVTDIWQFKEDFTVEEAKIFVENFDNAQNKEGLHGNF